MIMRKDNLTLKSVLISIKPKWCELISSGKKTIEVRKTRPRLEPPFKCYIYCTGAKSMNLRDYVAVHQATGGAVDDWSGKVIGEFVCDSLGIIEPLAPTVGHLVESCLSAGEMDDYLGTKRGFAWHISDLKIYDKPRELGEFYVHKYDEKDYCNGCVNHECPVTEYPCCECVEDEINRAYLYCPPQSWCYT